MFAGRQECGACPKQQADFRKVLGPPGVDAVVVTTPDPGTRFRQSMRAQPGKTFMSKSLCQ